MNKLRRYGGGHTPNDAGNNLFSRLIQHPGTSGIELQGNHSL